MSDSAEAAKREGTIGRLLYGREPRTAPRRLAAIVSAWYGWSEEELLLQLVGYLRGRALQEWVLLGEEDKTTGH